MNKKTYVDIYQDLNTENELTPLFDVISLQQNDGNRYLTSHEMRQVQNHQTITAIGLCSSNIQLDKVQQAIKQIGNMYKFLTSSITKTDDGKWYRYKMNSNKTLQLQIHQQNIITNIETQFKNYDTITLDNLFTAELYPSNIKHGTSQEVINHIIAMQVHHCLMDAQNLIALMKQFNTVYNQLLNNEIVTTNYIQVAPFRPINALINKLNIKDIAEKLWSEAQSAQHKIGKITNKETRHRQHDMINNILHEVDCNLKDYKLQEYNLTSIIYVAVAISFYQKALREQTISQDEGQLLILVDIKNIRQDLVQYESSLQDEHILGSFFIPNFIPVKISVSETLKSILDMVYQQQSAEVSKQKLIGTIIKCDYNKLQRDSSLPVNIMVSNLGKINLGLKTPVQDVITLSTEIVKNNVHNGIALLINQCTNELIISFDDLGYFSVDEQHNICANIITILKFIKQTEKELQSTTISDLITQLNNN